jgi:hypothetical protein
MNQASFVVFAVGKDEGALVGGLMNSAAIGIWLVRRSHNKSRSMMLGLEYSWSNN